MNLSNLNLSLAHNSVVTHYVESAPSGYCLPLTPVAKLLDLFTPHGPLS